MARGFESKSVADQQEAAMNPRPGGEKGDPKRRSLELARADILHRLENATGEAHRQMLQRALTDLDQKLADIPPPAPPPQE